MIDYLGISGVRGSVVCQDYSIAVRLSITGVGSGEAFPRGGVLSDSESLILREFELALPTIPFLQVSSTHSLTYHHRHNRYYTIPDFHSFTLPCSAPNAKTPTPSRTPP